MPDTFEDGLEQRYYFIEELPGYGQRQMGLLEGYSSIEDLKLDHEHNIKRNRFEGNKCWIVKREPVERLS